MDQNRIAHRLMELQDALDRVLRNQTDAKKGIAILTQKVDQLMALVDDLKAGMTKVQDAIGRVATKQSELIDRLRNTGLSDTEKAEVLDDLQQLTDHLDAISSVDPAAPVVPAPPAAMTKPKK